MADDQPQLRYDNSGRPAGWLVRVGSALSPGVRNVQAQASRYAAAWEESNALTLRTTGPLWVALGDSMTQGIGASSYDRGWVSQLRELLEHAGRSYRVLNLSFYGARVEDVLERQLPAMRRLGADPDLVTVLIGSNDIVSSRRRRYLSIDYGELLRALPPGTVVASPFANFGLGRELNALLAQEAADRGLRIVNSHDGTNLASWKGKLAEDHFHPNDAGYAALAQDFFKAIQEPP